jgi:hypothetical protein
LLLSLTQANGRSKKDFVLRLTLFDLSFGLSK